MSDVTEIDQNHKSKCSRIMDTDRNVIILREAAAGKAWLIKMGWMRVCSRSGWLDESQQSLWLVDESLQSFWLFEMIKWVSSQISLTPTFIFSTVSWVKGKGAEESPLCIFFCVATRVLCVFLV